MLNQGLVKCYCFLKIQLVSIQCQQINYNFFNIICNNTLSTFWYQPRVDKGQNLPWLNVAFVIFLGDIFY